MNNDNQITLKVPSAVIYGLLIFPILSRLLPHPMNITPVGALSLFAGAFLPLRIAWIALVTALLIGDAVSGFYHPIVMLFVYLGFVVGTLIGRLMLANKRTIATLVGGVLISASVFFVLFKFWHVVIGSVSSHIERINQLLHSRDPLFSLFFNRRYFLRLFIVWKL